MMQTAVCIQPWLLDLLCEPDTGIPLALASEGDRLEANQSSYRVERGIPLFVSPETTAHKATVFDYATHYATDAEAFDYFDDQGDPLTALHMRLLRTTVSKQVPQGAGLVLDVGCGCAYVARSLCPQGAKVVSLDIAPINVRKALEAYPYPNHGAVVADAYHLPFADGTFDAIVASEIIEHTVDPRGFLAALVAKLKPGGTLVVSTPYKERIAYSLCIHCNCKTPHNAHLHSFDKAKMHDMVSTLDADIVGIRLVGNKLLLHSHLASALSHLGYTLWSGVDRLANALLSKTEHFVITIRRRGGE